MKKSLSLQVVNGEHDCSLKRISQIVTLFYSEKEELTLKKIEHGMPFLSQVSLLFWFLVNVRSRGTEDIANPPSQGSLVLSNGNSLECMLRQKSNISYKDTGVSHGM